MTEWRKVRLGDCCEITSSKRIFYNEYVESGVPFYRSKEIIEKAKGDTISTPLYISLVRFEEIKESFGVPQKRDLLLTAVGSLGIPYLIKDSNPFYFKDGNLIWFKSFNDDLNSEFLYYWFKTRSAFQMLDKIAIGSAQKALTISSIKQISIQIPARYIQERIVTVLSRYDALIENYQRQIKLLEEAAQRLYKEWFVDLRFPGHQSTPIINNLPQSWQKKKLIELVNVQYGYAFDGSLFNSDKKGMPIVRIRNIPDGYTSDYTTEEASPEYVVRNGDILVGMDGIFHINSWSGGNALLVQRACSFRPKAEELRGFVFQAIKEPIKYFEKTLVGSTVAHLGKKHIDSIELLVPNNKELFEPFTRFFNQRQGLLAQIRNLSEARDRLLPKLMSGEIEV